jgi:hypothetical protein
MENLEKTVSQTIVGASFNPSKDDKVARAKQLCAELIDLVLESDAPKLNQFDFVQHTIGEILNAQMNAVKVLTLKK